MKKHFNILKERWTKESPNWGKILFKAATACGILVAALGEGGELAGVIDPEAIPNWFKTVTGFIIGAAALWGKLSVSESSSGQESNSTEQK